MSNVPVRTEIDHHTIKLIMGIIAISLAILTSLLSPQKLTSISASYYVEGWSGDIFVGFLFAIAAFLFSYNGNSAFELKLSKFAAIAALGVALFPCGCNEQRIVLPYVHYISAAVMFLILAAFCQSFYKRAIAKGHPQAIARSVIYAASGVVIILSILIMALDFILGGSLSAKVVRLMFYCEAVALVSFGIAWLTASRILPVITSKEERLPLSPYKTGNQ